MNIRRILASRKIRSVLTYWYRGVRYRPVLGYNLSIDQEREAALQIITAIHANTAQPVRSASQPIQFADQSDTTFSAFIPIYLQYLKAKRPTNDGRNEVILTKHIIPYFGQKRLAEIRLEDGLAYLEKRRSDVTGPRDNRRPVAAGTIERECAVLMAVLNLAVDMDRLDKNRLKRLPVPEYVKRERVLEGWELLKLKAAASPQVWRLILAALQIGLRENKLIETHEEWLMQRGDGWWMAPAPGRTKIKGVPKTIPLNRLAYEALFGGLSRIGGRFFGQWKDGNSFKHSWMRTCERAGIHGLHFHDLRHTFATWLMQCGVDYAVIQTLKGEPLPGSAKYYIHNWDGRLRDAVTRLESFTEALLNGENASEVPLTATQVPPSYVEQSLSPRFMVPRDRIELSTPAFSGHALCLQRIETISDLSSRCTWTTRWTTDHFRLHSEDPPLTPIRDVGRGVHFDTFSRDEHNFYLFDVAEPCYWPMSLIVGQAVRECPCSSAQIVKIRLDHELVGESNGTVQSLSRSDLEPGS